MLKSNIQNLATKNARLANAMQNALLLNANTKNATTKLYDTSIYTQAQIAKTNLQVAMFTNGKSAYSLYNPLRDASNFALNEIFSKKGFFVIAGLANGYHIEKILQNTNAFVLVVEKNIASLISLFEQNNFLPLLKNERFFITTIDFLKEDFLQSYLPHIHGDFFYMPLRSWQECNSIDEKNIFNTLNCAMDAVKSDFATQAHFGKIWMQNILQNVKSASKFDEKMHSKVDNALKKILQKKSASVIAAGPSLDKTITHLKQMQNTSAIIATDTASQVLLSNNITPDIILSIDGQCISYRHFLQNIPQTSLIVLDLCANPSIGAQFLHTNPVLFVQNNHPLCSLLQSFTSQQNEGVFFPQIDTSSGTVTISAIDLALKLGFLQIDLYGADFAYSLGKSYCKGTYLDKTFALSQRRTNPIETEFASLMFRSALTKKAEGVFTTKLLCHYANALDDYSARKKIEPNFKNLQIKKISAEIAVLRTTMTNSATTMTGAGTTMTGAGTTMTGAGTAQTGTCTAKPCAEKNIFLQRVKKPFPFADCIMWIFLQLDENCKVQSQATNAILPFFAWWKKHNNTEDAAFLTLVKEARKIISRIGSSCLYDQ